VIKNSAIAWMLMDQENVLLMVGNMDLKGKN